MNCIKLRKIRTYSFHGCLPEETIIGGNYEVNIDLFCDFETAAKQDDLARTIDYVAINKIVEEEMAKSSKLIETVAYRIVDRSKAQFETLERIRIEIRKINPPLDGDVAYVAVEVEA